MKKPPEIVYNIQDELFKEKFLKHFEVIQILNKELSYTPQKVIFVKSNRLGGANPILKDIKFSVNILNHKLSWFAFTYAHEVGHLKRSPELGRLFSTLFAAFFKFLIIPSFIGSTALFLIKNKSWKYFLMWVAVCFIYEVFVRIRKPYIWKSEFSADLIAYKSTGLTPDDLESLAPVNERTSDNLESGYPSLKKRTSFVRENGVPNINPNLLPLISS